MWLIAEGVDDSAYGLQKALHPAVTNFGTGVISPCPKE
jgi:hypothetical protein